MTIKIAVGGCRDYNDFDFICKSLDEYLSNYESDDTIIILSGHCSGVDSAAEQYASLKGFETIIFPAEWKKYGRAAGPVRNKQMVESSDIVIAFWDEKSKGTKSLINLAKKAGKTLIVYKI